MIRTDIFGLMEWMEFSVPEGDFIETHRPLIFNGLHALFVTTGQLNSRTGLGYKILDH